MKDMGGGDEWQGIWRKIWKSDSADVRWIYFCINNADVVNRVRNGESIPFRPQVPDSANLGKPIIDLMRNCWQENPDHRPSFTQIRTIIRKQTNGEWVKVEGYILYSSSIKIQ